MPYRSNHSVPQEGAVVLAKGTIPSMSCREIGSCLLLLIVLCGGLVLQGCASGSTNPPTPPSPPTPPDPGSVAFAPSTDGSKAKSLPVAITLNLNQGASFSKVKVTLNGVDVTYAFTAGSTSATAAMSKAVYVGSNRLKVTYGTSAAVTAAFTYDPSNSVGGGLPPGGSSTTLADVIPIQTRVRMTNAAGNQVWGIQIGQTAYPAPDATSGGFQVLVLKRTDLSMISNTNYPIVQGSSIQFYIGVAPASANYNKSCGLAGCMVIVQSLDTIGYAPCSASSFPSGQADCNSYQPTFNALGATGLISSFQMNNPAGIGYSLIANVTNSGLHTPSSYERITCSTGDGCVQQSNPGADTILAGIAPNGLDGTQPNLANTGATGTTNISATAYTPAMTVSNNGAIRGALLRDNYDNYIFNYTDPQIHFQSGAAQDSSTPKHIVILDDPSGLGNTFPNGQTQIALESGQLPAGTGGFHLVVLDATTFQDIVNATYVIDPTKCPMVMNPTPTTPNQCTSPDGSTLFILGNLISDLQKFNSRRYIFFLGSIGSLDHPQQDTRDNNSNYPGHNATMQDVWDRIAQSVQDIGGTYSLFTSLNYPGFVNNPYDQYNPGTVPEDDYNLVGQWWMNDTNIPNPLALEESTAIHRQTMKYPTTGNIDGVLEKGIDGYYRANVSTSNAGFLSNSALALTSAPTQFPVVWPLTGPNDSNALKAAYMWISQQLLNCVNGCGDVRAAYSNLNQSASIWLATLSDLDIPSDCAGEDSSQCALGFGQTDFDVAKAQLVTEIQYLGLVREYQNNVVGLLQTEQANVSLLLQQAADEVLGNITYVTSATITGGSWRSDVEDGFKIAGPLIGLATSFIPYAGPFIGPAINSSFGIADLIMDQGAKRAYDPNGRSLQEQAHDLVAVSALAQQKANQYAISLTSVGADFRRIVSDWGRLQAVGKPIQTNQLVWSPETSGAVLTAFNAAIRRSFYSKLLPVSFQITHYRYALPGTPGTYSGVLFRPGSPQCDFYSGLPNLMQQNPDSYAFIPGAPIDGPGSPVSYSVQFGNLYPFDLWWDLWMLQDKNDSANCPTNDTSQLPIASFYNTTGLFRPLDPANTTPLGLYKPWFFTRSGFNVNRQVTSSTVFWNDNSINGGQPYSRGMSDWHPDPDNY